MMVEITNERYEELIIAESKLTILEMAFCQNTYLGYDGKKLNVDNDIADIFKVLNPLLYDNRIKTLNESKEDDE